jgi:hypothetical protein
MQIPRVIIFWNKTYQWSRVVCPIAAAEDETKAWPVTIECPGGFQGRSVSSGDVECCCCCRGWGSQIANLVVRYHLQRYVWLCFVAVSVRVTFSDISIYLLKNALNKMLCTSVLFQSLVFAVPNKYLSIFSLLCMILDSHSKSCLLNFVGT